MTGKKIQKIILKKQLNMWSRWTAG